MQHSQDVRPTSIRLLSGRVRTVSIKQGAYLPESQTKSLQPQPQLSDIAWSQLRGSQTTQGYLRSNCLSISFRSCLKQCFLQEVRDRRNRPDSVKPFCVSFFYPSEKLVTRMIETFENTSNRLTRRGVEHLPRFER